MKSRRNQVATMTASGITDVDRLAVVRETLLTIFEQSLDALSEDEDLRKLARRLHLPYLAVKLIEQETTMPEDRSVSEDDIKEWLAWKAQRQA